MNVKSLMLLLAFAGLGASCSDDETNGGDTSGIAGRSELQIVFSGTGESQEYTKATASEGENKIDKLQVYLFASATGQAGSYYYMETWNEGTAFDSEDKDASGNPKTNFKKQDAGTGWKASIYPNELKGLPYIKLLCIANNGATDAQGHATTDGEFYQKDGTAKTAWNGALVAATTADNGDGVFEINNAAAATTETAFRASFTKVLGTDATTGGIIATPLLMTGEGQTKISGSVSKVDIDLKRIVARFDIDNTASKSNLTIQKLTLAQGRKVGAFWGTAPEKVEEADLKTTLTPYAAVEFDKLAGANEGLTESALYTYPNLSTDQTYLIIDGTYKSPATSKQVDVTYHVPIVRTPEGADKGEYIAIAANNRYKLRITDVTQSNIFGTFEVVDWTSGGGIVVKPDNDAPVFEAATGFEATTGNIPVAINDSKTAFTVEESSVFKTTIAATGKVRVEKSAAETKTASPDWLEIAKPEYKEENGVWYTTFEMTVDKATGELPVNVVFINEAASYDPALWTTLTFYGPKAKPTLATGGDGSTGNTVDYNLFTANMYNVVGSYIKVKAMCIEGTKLVLPENGEFVQEGEAVKEGYYSTFTIKVAKALTDGNEYAIKFQNSEEASAETTLTVTAVAAGLSATLENNSTYATISHSDASTYKVETDIDLLAANTYNLKIAAPEGATANIPSGKWLTVDGETVAGGVITYTVKATSGVTDFTDFDITFTNKLNTSEVLTVTMHKAASKPKFAEATGGAKSDFNEAPVIADYTSTASMYKANGSKISIKATCPEAMTFLEKTTSGLTISNKGEGLYEIEVNNATALTAATTEVIAQNTTAGAESRNATLTITWLDPKPAFTLSEDNDAAVVDESEADQINVAYASASDNIHKYVPIVITVTGYKGSTIAYTGNTSTWLNHTESPAEIAEGGTAAIEFTQTGCGNSDETADITITITSAIPNGGSRTITLKKQ